MLLKSILSIRSPQSMQQFFQKIKILKGGLIKQTLNNLHKIVDTGVEFLVYFIKSIKGSYSLWGCRCIFLDYGVNLVILSFGHKNCLLSFA